MKITSREAKSQLKVMEKKMEIKEREDRRRNIIIKEVDTNIEKRDFGKKRKYS